MNIEWIETGHKSFKSAHDFIPYEWQVYFMLSSLTEEIIAGLTRTMDMKQLAEFREAIGKGENRDS